MQQPDQQHTIRVLSVKEDVIVELPQYPFSHLWCLNKPRLGTQLWVRCQQAQSALYGITESFRSFSVVGSDSRNDASVIGKKE